MKDRRRVLGWLVLGLGALLLLAALWLWLERGPFDFAQGTPITDPDFLPTATPAAVAGRTPTAWPTFTA